ncbi:MAG: hypothetical protein DRQ41_06015 [Gammaproteobacteria bacterium]|nr:MAG: hypothetical protein DRQ41_06015 [Gammaproteobacteria bacterium]
MEKSRVSCHVFDDFLVEEVYLDQVSVNQDIIQFVYLVEGKPIRCSIRYNSIKFSDPALKSLESAKHFATLLAVLCSMRFGAILPSRLNFEKYSRYIDQKLLEFLKVAMRGHWSQHRYQLGKISYQHPKFVVDSSELGKDAIYPLWSVATVENPVEVILGSGSGKDSLLCSKILEAAEVKYDIVTYFHDTYGDDLAQEQLFKEVSSRLNYKNSHGVYFYDDYYPWLENRLRQTDVIKRAKDYFGNNHFRTEAGETLLTTMAMTPIQVIHGIPLLVLGHEKSADAFNLIEPESKEEISHQWTKSFTYHKAVSQLMKRMFQGVNSASLTKPIHDVKIFELLFKFEDSLPYATNSCNIQKPWCCKCEKCCYVFSGFSAYGDIEKTIKAFKNDLLDMAENLPVWADLLGLNGYVAWECVGLPEETQLYFYKLHLKGVKGLAMELFEREVLNPLRKGGAEAVEQYFAEIENQYSQLYQTHHTMPDWLWQKIRPVLEQ